MKKEKRKRNPEQRKAIGKWLGKIGVFTFGRMIAFMAGMATTPLVLFMLGAVIVGIIVYMGVTETMQVLDSLKAEPIKTIPA